MNEPRDPHGIIGSVLRMHEEQNADRERLRREQLTKDWRSARRLSQRRARLMDALSACRSRYHEIFVPRTLLAFVLCALVAIPISATRVQRLSLTAIRDSASGVFVIEVLGSSMRVGDARMVWTDYRVRIVDVLRGGALNTGDVIKLPFAGGEAEGLSVGIEGVPRLQTGARYVVFLDPVAKRPVPAIGWGQGLFRIESDGGDERLTSVDGESLRVDRSGALRRSSSVEAHHRLADPLTFNGDGSVAVQVPQPLHRNESRPASLDDLRQFVRAARPSR